MCPKWHPCLKNITGQYSVWHQGWTLQGDYILGTVSIVGNNEPQQIHWVLDGSDEPTFSVRLQPPSFLLNPGQSLLWQIDLPGFIRRKIFKWHVPPG